MQPLATAGELETHLQRELDQAGADQALGLASGAVRAYCGWDLSRDTATFYLEAGDGPLITLPTLELITLVEVRADGNIVDPTVTPYNASRKGQVWGCWVPKVQYEFDVEHGYDPIPDALKLVTLDLAARSISNPEGLVSATTGQVSRTWGSAGTGSVGGVTLTALHERLLDRYSLFNP